eukprot:3609599-Pyramimonas_sp.AAC.1
MGLEVLLHDNATALRVAPFDPGGALRAAVAQRCRTAHLAPGGQDLAPGGQLDALALAAPIRLEDVEGLARVIVARAERRIGALLVAVAVFVAVAVAVFVAVGL